MLYQRSYLGLDELKSEVVYGGLRRKIEGGGGFS